MENNERIIQALKDTEILKFPDKLISTSRSTTLHYYVLAEPYYLEAFSNPDPETKIREGKITWEKPQLLTPGYILNMEGFSDDAKNAFRFLAGLNPDIAGLLYKMKYKKESLETVTVPKTIEATFARIKDDLEENQSTLTAVIKGVDELWDVSLMKFVQQLIAQSAYKSQMPHYQQMGYLSVDEKGNPVVTRNLEGLPLAASEEIEKMFSKVKKGNLDPSVLKRELDQWGVFKAYEDRFFDLFR